MNERIVIHSQRRPCVVAILLFFLSFALWTARSGYAQQVQTTSPLALKRLTLEELSDIEVTTESKDPVKLSRTPAAVFVITREDIWRSGVTSLPEALRLAPGVEVARIDANNWAVGIRGFGTRLSRSVLVLIDGRTVYTPLFAGTYWQVQDTLLEDVDRIEVIRGPGGTIWGPNAVNGVINIITQNAANTHGTLASVGGGNVEQGFLDFRYGGGNGKNTSYRFYGKGFNRSSEFHQDGQNFDRWRSAQTGFRLDWAKQDRDTITFQGDMYKMSAGESVAGASYTPPYSFVLNKNAPLSGGNILARWTKRFAGGSDIQLQGYYDRTNRAEPNFAETRNTFDVDFVHHLSVPGRQNVIWGLGARSSIGDTSAVISGLTFTPGRSTDKLVSAFVQDEIGIVGNRLMLTVGSKLLHTNYTGFAAEPSARLLWAPTAKQTVWLAATHALRTPSRAESDIHLLGYLGVAIGLQAFGRFDGNPDFQPEQLNSYELGYRQRISSKVSVDLTTFYNHYHDLLGQALNGGIFIEAVPAPQHIILPAHFVNLIRGNTKGIEIAPDWRPTNRWRLVGSYSYVHINLTEPAGSQDSSTIGGTTGSTPQHQVAAQSLLDLPKRLEFSQIIRYASALPAQSAPGYTTADLRLSWRTQENVELSLVGQNLLQPHHPEYGGDPGAIVGIKRGVYARLTWTR